MADSRIILLIIIIFYLSNFSGPQQQPYGTLPSDSDILEHEAHAFNVLNSSEHGDFSPSLRRWQNITGLKEEEGFNWFLLNQTFESLNSQLSRLFDRTIDQVFDSSLYRSSRNSLFCNITSTIGGEWCRLETQEPPPHPVSNLTDIPPHRTNFERNITGRNGGIRFNINSNENMVTAGNGSIREVTAVMRIDDGTPNSKWWDVQLFGVHFVYSGTVVLTTTSEKFAGIFALPHMLPTADSFQLSKTLLSSTLGVVIEDQRRGAVSLSNHWSSLPEGATESLFSSPKCEFVVFLQQHKAHLGSTEHDHTAPLELINRVEREARFPTGYISRPNLKITFSMAAISPDCDFVIESKGPPRYNPGENFHLSGVKIELYNENVRHAILALSGVLAAQIVLFKRQMKESSTPSTRNRISFWTVAALCFGDGLVFLALLLASVTWRQYSLILMATAFLALSLVFFFGLRFLMDIWVIQATELQRQQRQHAVNTSENTVEGLSTAENRLTGGSSPDYSSLPPPVTSQAFGNDTGASPVMFLSDQARLDTDDDNPLAAPDAATRQRRELLALYSRFCFFLLLFIGLFIYANTWPVKPRSALRNFLAFAYFSFWWPQIIRNMRRNCRKALRWDFVFGQTVLRLLPFLYIYAVKSNIFYAKNDVEKFLLLCCWSWFQIMALLSQDFIGSRFFVPNNWVPPAYDYHPVIKEDEEGILLPFESHATGDDCSSPSKSVDSKKRGMRIFDCTICTQDIEVPVVPISEGSEAPGSGKNLFARRSYMVTPCRHIFHTTCLESWMRYRLQCPNCREILPPL